MQWTGSENPDLHGNIKKSSSFGTMASCILHSHVRVNFKYRDRSESFYKKDIEEFEDTKWATRIEEEQTTKWPNEKGQKDKQRSEKTYT